MATNFRFAGPSRTSAGMPAARSRMLTRMAADTAVSTPALCLTAFGSASVQGTSRARNEDRYDVQVSEAASDGAITAFLGVYDGHGGYATSEWLKRNLHATVTGLWEAGATPERCVTRAFLAADKVLLKPTGFMGMGERGVGGSKCGSTAATATIWKGADGKLYLMAANVGDARVLLSRGGKVMQLTTDHVPDDEDERARVESLNPNPKMPLVRFVGETWRVGGLLALSRAFGDAYMKGSLQFEGVSAGSDGYSSGFGVIAEPTVQVVELTAEDSWVVVCSDGLFANAERGGGGGLENQAIIDACERAGDMPPQELAKQLCRDAQAAGSTDDVSAIVYKLF